MISTQKWQVKRSAFIRYELWKIIYNGWDGVGSRRYREKNKVVRFWTKKSAQNFADKLNLMGDL